MNMHGKVIPRIVAGDKPQTRSAAFTFHPFVLPCSWTGGRPYARMHAQGIGMGFDKYPQTIVHTLEVAEMQNIFASYAFMRFFFSRL